MADGVVDDMADGVVEQVVDGKEESKGKMVVLVVAVMVVMVVMVGSVELKARGEEMKVAEETILAVRRGTM